MTLAGCFEVKNTDGIRAAYEKIELAYPLAAEIKARQNLEEAKRQTLIDSYNEAKAAVNSFLEDIKTKSVKIVDVPRDTFEKDRANELIDKFIRDAKASRETSKALEIASVGAAISIVVPIINEIWKLHQEDEKDAYNRFVKIIDDNKMVEFSKVIANK